MDHAVVATVCWLCGFLLVVSALEHYTRRSVIPPVCWLLVAGVVYGALRSYAGLELPALHVGPHVVLFVFLPLLIFNSSRRLSVSELRAVLPEASFYALVGPLAGMVLVGVPLHVLSTVGLTDAFLFGAALGATDPVAVAAVFRAFPVPDRLQTLLEGESLLNDGIAVVLFSVLVGRAVGGGALSIPFTALSVAASVLGALVVGGAVGALGGLLMRHWHELHDRFIGSLLPLVAVYAAFLLGEHALGVSGVIAVMSATLVLSALHRHREGQKAAAAADRFFDDFWGFLADLVNAVLFFILGERMGEHVWRLTWYFVPAMVLALLLSRAAVVYIGAAALHLVRRRMPSAWRDVLAVGGLRGALSVALLLLLPEDYEHRHLFLCLAFALVFFTLIVNTLALRAYLKRRPVAEA
jgi:CPA1 family monovalent cation:H+ antiporter